MVRKAKIVATLGPASQSNEKMSNLMHAGMNVARLNFSHGLHEEHAEFIRNLRSVSERLNHPLAILQDLQGPKIRVGHLEKPAILELGDTITLFAQEDPTPAGDGIFIPVDFPELFLLVHGGERILLDDGHIELMVVGVKDRTLSAHVKVGGKLSSNKGINIPGFTLSISGFTEKDRSDLEFGLSLGIDMVAISFVQSAEDVITVRNAIDEIMEEDPHPLLIAKLERPAALDNLLRILEVSDGVMVARGDLGVEMLPERVPIAQKRIIQEANRYRKLVITATQMLDSMIINPLPTRAEASDVANAIFDGTDAVMLSGETASGDYPVESVTMMDRIVREAENNFPDWGHFMKSDTSTGDDAEAITSAACELAHDLNVSAIAVFTQTGRTALLMSKMRPRVPIFAFTPVKQVYQRLAAMWGVVPFIVPMRSTLREMVNSADEKLIGSGWVKAGEQTVVISGFPVQAIRPPNMALLHTVGEKM
jgi:pyruvate kinase